MCDLLVRYLHISSFRLTEGASKGMAPGMGFSSTYGRLRHSIAERMRMSPIDQQLMLVESLGRRSHALKNQSCPPGLRSSVNWRPMAQTTNPRICPTIAITSSSWESFSRPIGWGRAPLARQSKDLSCWHST